MEYLTQPFTIRYSPIKVIYLISMACVDEIYDEICVRCCVKCLLLVNYGSFIIIVNIFCV